jgi:hypothetical protein
MYSYSCLCAAQPIAFYIDMPLLITLYKYVTALTFGRLRQFIATAPHLTYAHRS